MSKDDWNRPFSEAVADLEKEGCMRHGANLWRCKYYWAVIKPNGGIRYTAEKPTEEKNSTVQATS